MLFDFLVFEHVPHEKLATAITTADDLAVLVHLDAEEFATLWVLCMDQLGLVVRHVFDVPHFDETVLAAGDG